VRNIKKQSKIRLIAIIVLLCVLLTAAMIIWKTQSPVHLVAQNGVLDLSDEDLKHSHSNLSGEWEFYWNRLYTYQDFQTQNIDETQYIEVPKTWNSYKIDGENLPGFGYATYRVKVKVSEISALSLRLDSMSTAYRLYVNDIEIASNGTVGTSKETSKPYFCPSVVDFTPPASEFYIIIQVSNFTYARGGIWYEINLGSHAQIDTLGRIITYKDAILIGSLLIMALYYASFYLVLRKDKTSKYFMILCIIFIVRTALYGDMLIKLLIFLTYASLYWIPVVIYWMIESIYECKLRFPFKKAFLLYGISATVFTAFLPISVYTSFVTLIEAIGILIVAFSVYLVVRAFCKKKKWAWLILLAAVIILATGVHDVLYQANVIHHCFGEMASIGIFMFMFAFAFIIASRLSYDYEQSKLLSAALTKALEKEKESSVELLKTELSFLQAQIKPHFIYNSLIAAFTLDEPVKAKELLYHLTAYLRGSFNFENYNGLTTLTDELETVKAYIAIEKARFEDKLQVKYDIDENISIFIPMLTIQPVVENAVRHGILKKPGGGMVILRIYREESSVVIKVEDNGIGMDKQKAENLMVEQGNTKGVGLKNINRRLHLFYGSGLTIQSEESVGTIITIRIPEKGGDLDESNHSG